MRAFGVSRGRDLGDDYPMATPSLIASRGDGQHLIRPVLDALERIVIGKSRQIQLALACLLARGHLLIEDVPGVGKTTLAHALAKALGLSYHRVQFTSDLLPADVLGVSVFHRDTGKEAWRAGGIKESWNTPILVSLPDGKTELVLAIFGKVLGFDPATGKQLWSCATDIGWYMVPSLVAKDGVVYCVGGRTGGGLAVKAGGSGDLASKAEGYVAARSNEFGFANYELIPAPVFLGTEVKDPEVPTGQAAAKP